MALLTAYPNGEATTGASGSNAAGAPMPTALVGVYDATRMNAAAADVIELIKVPAGTVVHDVIYEVLVGDAAQTMNVGDGDDPDGYVAAADVAAAGIGIGGGAIAVGGPKFYAVADTIDLEVPATMAFDTLKVRVTVNAFLSGVAG